MIGAVRGSFTGLGTPRETQEEQVRILSADGFFAEAPR